MPLTHLFLMLHLKVALLCMGSDYQCQLGEQAYRQFLKGDLIACELTLRQFDAEMED